MDCCSEVRLRVAHLDVDLRGATSKVVRGCLCCLNDVDWGKTQRVEAASLTTRGAAQLLVEANLDIVVGDVEKLAGLAAAGVHYREGDALRSRGGDGRFEF